MKEVVKYVAVGVAGYLIGFYEMKHKTVRLMLEGVADGTIKIKEESTKKNDKGESQQ